MLGFPILYFKSMRLMMFQLSGFYCILSLQPSFRAPLGKFRDGSEQGRFVRSLGGFLGLCRSSQWSLQGSGDHGKFS